MLTGVDFPYTAHFLYFTVGGGPKKNMAKYSKYDDAPKSVFRANSEAFRGHSDNFEVKSENFGQNPIFQVKSDRFQHLQDRLTDWSS